MKEEYRDFAKFYDTQMSTREMQKEYSEWIKITKNEIKNNKIKVKTVLDLCCGTGNTTLFWLKEGYKVIGVDLSNAMLKIARKKSKKVKWLRQNAVKLKIKEKPEVITCFFDSINHIIGKDKIEKTFKRVYETLNKKALFIFDLNTKHWHDWLDGRIKVFKIKQGFIISSPTYDKKKHLAYFKEILLMRKNNHYKELRIEIIESNYNDKLIKKLLKKVGFKKIKTKVLRKVNNKPSRVMFIATKQKT